MYKTPGVDVHKVFKHMNKKKTVDICFCFQMLAKFCRAKNMSSNDRLEKILSGQIFVDLFQKLYK